MVSQDITILLKINKTVGYILCYYLQMNVKLALQLLGVHRRTSSRYVKEGKRLAKKRCKE